LQDGSDRGRAPKPFPIFSGAGSLHFSDRSYIEKFHSPHKPLLYIPFSSNKTQNQNKSKGDVPMKKKLSILLALLLVFCLVFAACSNT
jgi:hypothetical protein